MTSSAHSIDSNPAAQSLRTSGVAIVLAAAAAIGLLAWLSPHPTAPTISRAADAASAIVRQPPYITAKIGFDPVFSTAAPARGAVDASGSESAVR